MKSILTTIVVGCGLAISATPVHAAPASQLADFAKSYGDFKPGFKFKLKVKSVTCSKTEGTKVIKNAPIPKSMPNYKKNAKVQFTIGSKGELKGPKFSAKFQGTTGPSINDYVTPSKDGFTLSSTARVEKNTKKKPDAAVLNFAIRELKGFSMVAYQLTYTLE